jgi:glycosyltransferase involved in cell wall biosynthesis
MKISIVTPNYNQRNLLDRTIRSVLDQSYPNLEYIIIDGNSKDGSQEVIKQYADKVSYWCSESDQGQYDAINKGFNVSSGEIMGWLNSSDIYMPWTLKTVNSIFTEYPQVQWISSLQKVGIMEDGQFELIHRVPGFSARRFTRGLHGGPACGEFIQQESCFWRRSLWEKVGGKIDTSYHFAADFKLWGDFFQHERCTGVDAPLAAFRFHDSQRSAESKYLAEVEHILEEFYSNRQIKPMTTGYQNLMRHRGLVLMDSCWRLDTNTDEMHLDILKFWNDLFTKLIWKISTVTYLPLGIMKFLINSYEKSAWRSKK